MMNIGNCCEIRTFFSCFQSILDESSINSGLTILSVRAVLYVTFRWGVNNSSLRKGGVRACCGTSGLTFDKKKARHRRAIFLFRRCRYAQWPDTQGFPPQSLSAVHLPSGAVAHLPVLHLTPAPQSASAVQELFGAVAHLPLLHLTPAPQSSFL